MPVPAPTKTKAVLYLRSSNDKHDASPAAQRRALLSKADAMGLAIVDEYADVCERGTDENRPALQAMLRDAKSRQWNAILAYDTSRLARDVNLAGAIHHAFAKLGVDIIYASIPATDAAGMLILTGVFRAMDEIHSMKSRERGLAGMKENILQGWRAGGKAPYGYRLEHVKTGAIRDGAPVQKSRLAVDPDTGPKAAALLKGIAAGRAAAALADELGLTIARSTINGMIRNALAYAGHTVWNKGMKFPRGGYPSGQKHRPEDQHIIQRDTHPPLITEAEAAALLALVGKRKRQYFTRSQHLLSGLIRTGNGDTWHGNAKTYRVGTRNIGAARLESAVLAAVARDLDAPEFTRAILAQVRELQSAEGQARQSARLAQDIAAKRRESARLAAAIGQTDEPGPLVQRLGEVEKETRALLAAHAEATASEAQSAALASIGEKEVKAMLADMGSGLRNLPREGVKEALRGLIEKIELEPGGHTCRIHYRLAVPAAAGDFVATPRGAAAIPTITTTCYIQPIAERAGRRGDH